MRIVSLLPSTTEIVFGLGAGDDVVGVTFECDHPPAARERRVVSTSTMPSGLTASEIDAFVADALRRGEDLYRLDADALADLDADLVLTQDLCAVCAIDVDTVDQALQHLGCRADVLTVDPHTLEEVLGSIATIGDRLGLHARARAWVGDLRARLAAVQGALVEAPRPRVLLLEWTDPPYAPGHWVPEMVRVAGGDCVLGAAGQKSVRVRWEEVEATRPDVVVCAPCGFGTEAAAELAVPVAARFPGLPVWAVDADAAFARPGPRLVDGVETLAAVLHPDLLGVPDPLLARRIQ